MFLSQSDWGDGLPGRGPQMRELHWPPALTGGGDLHHVVKVVSAGFLTVTPPFSSFPRSLICGEGQEQEREGIKLHLPDSEASISYSLVSPVIRVCPTFLINHFCEKRISQIPPKYLSFSMMDNRMLDELKITTPHSNFIQFD